MNMMKKTLRSERGFSLLEVLIALGLTAVITSAILRAYVTQHEAYLEQDDATAIQQSARAALDEIAKHTRMAGNNLPIGLQPLGVADANPDTIVITYRTDNCDTYLADTMTAVTSALECATAVDCFSDGDWAYIYEPDSGGGEWFQVSTVDLGAGLLNHDGMPLTKRYHTDAIVLTMDQIRFFVDQSNASNPTLMMQLPGQAPAIFADNVSDLQLRYRLKNGLMSNNPALVEDIREVEITITGIGQRVEPDADGNTQVRTRTYTSAVNLRNAGL